MQGARARCGPLEGAVPLVDEHVRDVGREVREFATLHMQLANEEARYGSTRLLSSLFMMGFGVAMFALVLMAGGVATFLFLREVMPPAGAAALVAVGYLLVGAVAWWAAWRLIQGAGSLLLPQTRALLWELISCRDEAKNSPPSSGPGVHT